MSIYYRKYLHFGKFWVTSHRSVTPSDAKFSKIGYDTRLLYDDHTDLKQTTLEQSCEFSGGILED